VEVKLSRGNDKLQVGVAFDQKIKLLGLEDVERSLIVYIDGEGRTIDIEWEVESIKQYKIDILVTPFSSLDGVEQIKVAFFGHEKYESQYTGLSVRDSTVI